MTLAQREEIRKLAKDLAKRFDDLAKTANDCAKQRVTRFTTKDKIATAYFTDELDSIHEDTLALINLLDSVNPAAARFISNKQ